MKKSAFTLIELIIVITIISVIIGFIIVDFRSAIQRQEIAVVTDQVYAMMQQSRTEVKSGKKEGESDGEEEPVLLCEGGYFKVGEIPLFALTQFDIEANECNFLEFRTENYGTRSGGISIASITVGGSGLNELWAIYEPPNGEVAFLSATGERQSGDAEFLIQHERNEELQFTLSLSAVTNQLTLSSPNEEESE